MNTYGINMHKWNRFVVDWQLREACGAGKYLHLRTQIDENIELLQQAGLMNITGKRVLDICSGIGVTLAIFKHWGNEVLGVDNINDVRSEIYLQSFMALDLPPAINHSYKHPNYEFVPLPDIGMFDVITCIAGTPMTIWDLASAGRFVNDCFNHLNTGGILFIAPNDPLKSRFGNLNCCEKIIIKTREAYKFRKDK